MGDCTDKCPSCGVLVQAAQMLREIEQRTRGGLCRMYSEGDACDCALCRRDAEIERLRAENADLRARGKIREEAVPRLYEEIADRGEEIERLRAKLNSLTDCWSEIDQHGCALVKRCARALEAIGAIHGLDSLKGTK